MIISTKLLIDCAVVVGVGVVAPLSLAVDRRDVLRWLVAAAAVGGGLTMSGAADPVTQALLPLLALPAAALALQSLRRSLRHGGPTVLAAAWAAVAIGAIVVSTLGGSLLGHEEPIVRLTAVHYLFAGTGALTLAAATGSTIALRCTAAGPPVVALGFASGSALPQVGGAVLMAIGVLATAVRHLRRAAGPGPASRRVLLAASGIAVWAPMVLAVAWAAGQHWDVPSLSVPAMVPWHGAPNAVGFVICGLLASRLPGTEGGARP